MKAGWWRRVDGNVPGNTLGNSDVSNTWGNIRQGVEGTVSIPDTKAGVLVQSAGEDFRLTRKGPLFSYLGLAMLGTLIALAIFFESQAPANSKQISAESRRKRPITQNTSRRVSANLSGISAEISAEISAGWPGGFGETIL